MASFLKRMLSPLFNALAAPGLGNPHTPYEAELMTAGVKPVAIMSPHMVTPEMQAVIDTGAIVMAGEKEFERNHRIYCQLDQLSPASDAARILGVVFQDETPVSQEDGKLIWDLFRVPGEDGAPARAMPISSGGADIQYQAARGQATPEIDAFLAGRIKALPPMLLTEQTPVPQVLEDAVAQGRIAAVDMTHTMTMQVFAQASRAEDGRELFARYYGNDEGYEPLEGEDGARRIAALLGYTENDVCWFLGTKYQNPVVHQAMEATSDLRHWARKEAMLLNGPG